MGFSKDKGISEVRVPLSVPVVSEDEPSGYEYVSVLHVFKVPAADVREEYQRRLIVIKGRKLKQGSRSEAAWFLWRNCIMRVEGYDDLPTQDVEGEWKKYFHSDDLASHVEGAIDKLMEVITVDEADIEKKSEPSSE